MDLNFIGPVVGERAFVKHRPFELSGTFWWRMIIAGTKVHRITECLDLFVSLFDFRKDMVTYSYQICHLILNI
ncbi:hypothetical protein HanLR1_Chr01g0023081 [Helianthus annuus]|nr:hypothetical protein HanLR1_Chr01g0023081 [Helianthus annuus]